METSENDTSKRIVRIVVVATVVFLALLVLWPRAKERLAPDPVRAHVAVRPAGAEAAVVGPVEVEPGVGFTLHAVLEAEARGGEGVYYTEAPALEIGGERVPAEALRRWDRPLVPKLFWFTVEGPAPYLELEAPENLDRFAFTEYFHPEWPTTWSVPGRLESRYDQNLAREGGGDGALAGSRPFGTQRYQVRVELFEDEEDLTPAERFVSAGGDALPDGAPSFPTVYAAYPGAAGPASLAFGLTQIAPPDEVPPELRRRLTDLTERRLAFSRLALLRAVMAAAGTEPDALAWDEVDLTDGPSWGEDAPAVERGDLLRAGGRVVVLYDDRGVEGTIDRRDLCFDYEQGAAVLPLAEVFVGEGLLELARL